MSTPDWSELRESLLAPLDSAAFPETLELPALPHAVTLFLERSRDESADTRALAAIVETDAGLTFELLRHVNSAYVGLRTKARTAAQAIAYLGLRQTRMLIITTGTQAAIRARKSRLINQHSFWNSSLQKAIFARELASLLQADEEAAFAGALLQDYMLPVLTNELLDEYVSFTDQRDRLRGTLPEWERSTFRWDHALLAGLLGHRWGLPDELVCCLVLHHMGLRVLADPRLRRTSVAAVALSALLPDQLRQHYDGLEQLVLLQEKWPVFRLEELIKKVDAEHAKLGLGVENSFPLSRRCKPVFERMQAASATAPAL